MVRAMGLVDGKVAFITGVARGQGRSHAVRLAQEGADIIGVDICEDVRSIAYPMASDAELDETGAMIEATGRRALLRKADVRSFEQLDAVVAEGLTAFGHIDVVCANAGIVNLSPSTTPEEVQEGWDNVIGINLTGVWNTVRAAAVSMLERKAGGSVIITSSIAGLKPMSTPGVLGGEAYGTAKAGLVGLMRSLAVELSPASIRVNTIHPTGVNTMMINNDAIRGFLENMPEQMRALTTLENLLPVTMLEPGDISDVVVFLASDAAKYITGVTLPVDAGFLLK
jgi:SDR family mycofactocin-dependent oxidoreductase